MTDGDAPTEDLTGRPPPASSVAPGARVGRYLVRRCIDKGGMGVVFEAYDEALRRRVALKMVLPAAVRRDPSFAARLVREARAAAGLSHPNVVHVYEVGLHESGPFLAMELVDGVTVRQWLKQAPRRWPEILRIFVQAARGLAAAHAAGIVHRDIKPDNILVGADRVRVADFGLADIVAAAHEGGGGDDDAVTQAGTIMGTPRYMAPEQRDGEPADARSDQYSLCLSLYEALLGRLPDGPVAAVDRGAAAPLWLQRAVVTGLAVNPAARWPDVETLLRELARDPAARRRRWAAAGGAAALAVAAALVAYRAGRAPDPCRDGASALAGVWDARSRASLEAAFGATGRANAPATFSRVAARLDGYAADWVRARQASCPAAKDPLADARSRCLDHQLARVRELVVQLLRHADESLDHAVDATQRATTELCRDDAAVAARHAGADELERRTLLAKYATKSAIIEAATVSGKWQEVHDRYLRILPKVRDLDLAPLLGEVLRAHAMACRELGLADEALATALELVRVAGRARDPALQAEGWIEVLSVAQDPDKALAYLPAAETAIAGAADSARLRAALGRPLARIYLAQGKREAARAELAAALAVEERAPSAALVATLDELGDVEAEGGDAARAESYHRRGAEAAAALYGEHHPVVAASWAGLGHDLALEGRLPEARAALERARDGYHAAGLRDDDPRIARLNLDLSGVAARDKDLDAAERAWNAALTATPAGAPLRVEVLAAGGQLDNARGRFEAGRQRCSDGLVGLDPRDRRAIDLLVCVGESLVGLDRAAEALEPLGRAVALAEELKLPPAQVAELRQAQARALRRAGP